MAASHAATKATRSTTNVWLVGQLLSSIDGPRQLPTSGVALRRVFYEMKVNKATLPIACSSVADEIMTFWVNANIPTTAKPHVVAKLKILHKEHCRVSKHKDSKSPAQVSSEEEFSKSMNILFDIAHADWDYRVIIQEDKNFLIDQRGPRQMSMSSEDMKYKQTFAKYRKRKHEEESRHQRHKALLSTAASVHLSSEESSDDNHSNGKNSTQSRETFASPRHPHQKMVSGQQSVTVPKRCVIDNPLFNAALDRTKTTPRQAMMIVTPALAAAGIDVNQLSLSRSSLMEARYTSRESLASTVRQDFQPSVPLVAHFDGKLLPYVDGTKRDCLPIVVSGLDIEKLLGIPKLPVGTGALMGQKVVEFVREWPGVEEHLAGLCFDTTASNTGIHTGAITIVQQSFNRRLLFLACRHHIFELCAAAVFDAFFVSKGPEIELFGRLKSQWEFIDKSKFEPLDSDESGAGSLTSFEKEWLASRKADVIKKLKKHLRDAQPREDYREFGRLALLLLGEDDGAASICTPGAYHRARWMAKGIYCIKIFGFRHQLHMSKQEMGFLRRICLFVTTIYVCFWFSAPLTTDAPINDLYLLQEIEDYSLVDSKIASVAGKKIRLQLWYLSEDLAALPLFSDEISIEEKVAIVNALQNDPSPSDVRRLAPNKMSTFRNLSIAEFVTRRSMNLFDALSLPHDFLTSSPDTWIERDDYNAARQTVRAMRVVNDCAERAVKLATDFNEVLTKNEDQRHLLYQVVEYHRKLLPTNATKRQLSLSYDK